MVPMILAAFANDDVKSLSLIKEREELRGVFSDPDKFELKILDNAGFDYINQTIIQEQLQERIVVFHYAGPANGKNIRLVDGDLQVEALKLLLNSFPNLQLVFLNGCDTYEQAAEIQATKNKAAILTTLKPVFSESGRQVISQTKGGAIIVWDAENGNILNRSHPRNINYSYLSPKGDYYIVGTPEDIYLFRASSGSRVNIPDFTSKYGQLKSAIFSEDGAKAVLTLRKLTRAVQPQQQKGEYYSSENYNATRVLMFDLRKPNSTPIELNSFVGRENLASFEGGSPNILVDEDRILFAPGNGTVRILTPRNEKPQIIQGNGKLVTTMSITRKGGFVMTSDEEYKTKVWELTSVKTLGSQGRLPGLTTDDLRKIGLGQ